MSFNNINTCTYNNEKKTATTKAKAQSSLNIYIYMYIVLPEPLWSKSRLDFKECMVGHASGGIFESVI